MILYSQVAFETALAERRDCAASCRVNQTKQKTCICVSAPWDTPREAVLLLLSQWRS